MKPVMQDKFGLGGNCLSACIASLLELPLSEVPSFHGDFPENTAEDNPEAVQVFWANVHRFLNARGYGMFHMDIDSPEDLKFMSGYFLIGGKSPRGYSHSVIYTKEGLAHDPHPEGGGVEMSTISIVYPFFDGVYHASN